MSDPSAAIATIDAEKLAATLSDLVSINSINPDLVPGAPGEASIAADLVRRLDALGLDVQTHEAAPGRVSVVARLAGQGGGRSLMLNGHTDTVGVDGMGAPFAPRVESGRLYGRGAYDMKASLASCLAALEVLATRGPRLAGDLLFAAVADEEYASIGTADVIARYPVDGAIVTEPTELAVCTAHKGFVWLEVETLGRAAHGSRFDEGVDANLRMGRFLNKLETLERALRARPGHALVGPPSLHAALLAGGSGLSTYAERCTLRVERRTIPGETGQQVLDELQAIAGELAAADASFRATVKSLFVREPFEVAAEATIVQAVRAAAHDVRGVPPAMIGQTFWMDAALFAAAGIETVVIGPAGAGAHSRDEWVDLDSAVQLAAILVRAAAAYCGLAN